MAETDSGAEASSALGKAAEVIERLSDHVFALHVLPAFLVLDIALLTKYQKNVLEAPWKDLSTASLGWGVCLFVAYLAAMTMAIPIVQGLTRPALIRIWDWFDAAMSRLARAVVGPSHERPFIAREARVSGTAVWLTVAKERALRDRDSFWLAIVHDKEARLSTVDRAEKTLATLSFATVFFGLIDAFVFPGTSILSALADGLTGRLGVETEQVGSLALLVMGFVVAAPWWAKAFSNGDARVWIQHPALAEELMNDFLRKQAELRGPTVAPWRGELNMRPLSKREPTDDELRTNLTRRFATKRPGRTRIDE